ncbi:amino acid adenylation domain-containing protein [Plantactinospora sp. B6F1]|uniref:amino acid adenylation domain-containing protein n=1 Tax=Plantactinospora sp. B6F1 TaxID=3158971 RepID=UPI0032D8DA35
MTGDSRPLIDALLRRAEREPARVGYRDLDTATGALRDLTYADAATRVAEVAARLRESWAPGQRVALAIPGGLDYLVNFLGILAAGLVAVPLPPRGGRPLQTAELADHPIVRDAGAVAAFGPDGLAGLARPTEAGTEPAGSELAVLQYTSGSTGVPKGVMVTHANLAHNTAAITDGMTLTPADRALVWLPPYHDMGLVGGMLSPLWSGMSMTLMPAEAFVRRPLAWLRLVSEGRVTVSGGPNFAFDLCVERIPADERAALDLSAWAVAFTGAEPVRAGTLRRFAEAFAVAGFRPEAFYPCYGMAEATLIVSGGARLGGLRFRADDAPDVPERVSNGSVLGGQTLTVLDPETGVPADPGETGELVLRGPSVTAGYWRRPAETAAVYRTDGLRTGDIGRIVNGEVFITGRLKDIVVVRGRNIHAEDVEEILRGVDPVLCGSAAAAFAVEPADGSAGEQLVAAIEAPARGVELPADFFSRARAAILAATEASPAALLLVRRGGLPRTTSGKVRRSVARDRYRRKELPVLHEDRPAGGTFEASADAPEGLAGIVADLCARVAAVGGVAEPRGDVSLLELGLDSLALLQLQGDIATHWGVEVLVADLMAAPSVIALATLIAEGQGGAAATGTASGGAMAEANGDGIRYLERYHAGTTMHVLGRAFRLGGDVDPDALEQTLRLLFDRHPALRATTAGAAGEPPPSPVLRRIDLRGRRAEAVDAAVHQVTNAPFDPAAAGLLRAALVETDAGRILAVAVHHAAVDLWSAALLLAEFAEIYRALRSGAEPVLPEPGRLPGPGDVEAWERLREWWAAAFHGYEAGHATLPADYPASGMSAEHVGVVRRTAGDLPGDALAAAATRLGTTAYTVLVAALAAQLARYAGGGDVVLGTPVAGRGTPALRGVVGFLANSVPLRLDGAAGSLAELVRRAHRAVTAALDHQALPFAEIVEAAGASRRDGRNPLFDVLFVYHRPPAFAPAGTVGLALGLPGVLLDLGGLRAETLPLPSTGSAVELTVEVGETEAGTVVALRYDADRFDEATAAAMLDEYVATLRSALADPSAPVTVARAGTEPLPAAGPFRDVLDRIREHSRSDAVAVRQGPSALTYRGLWRQATGLAARLAARGVGPEVCVGVAVPRTPQLLVALLGILRAGGAYCPVDLTLPPARLDAIRRDARLALALATRATVGQVPAGWPVLLLDDGDAAGGGSPAGSAPHPEQLAHVLFTSGSTGRPKSVAMTRRNLAAFIGWGVRAYPAGQLAGVLAGTPLTFDLSVFELLVTVAAGGTVIIAEDALQLSRLPEREHVTLLNTVPSIAAQLVADGLPAGVGAVNLAGEPLPAALVRDLAHADVGRIVNLYGPTEATTYATVAEQDPADRRLVTIGTGLPAVGARVRAAGGRAAGTGEPGELYLGGAQVARGYLADAAATADRFGPDPAGAPGTRAYRTGDLVRRRHDGHLIYLGRGDRQVKVRGVRIELDEIEAVLGAHPSVREAAVVVHRAGEPDAALAAYVVGDADAAVLRAHVAAALPAAMVPVRWLALDALPRNARGKLDREALARVPVPAEHVPARRTPRTPTERTVAEIWANLLGVTDPDPDADFFMTGGHSLLAMRLLTAVEERTAVRLPLGRLLDQPTIAGLAARLDEAGASPVAPAPATDDAFYPLSPTQERLCLLQALAPDSPAYHIAGQVRLRGPLDPGRLERALRAVVDRHDGLRVRLETREGNLRQRVGPAAPVHLPVEEANEADIPRLAAEAATAPFDLTAASPWRARLLRAPTGDHHLIFVAHHAICDGWSLDLLARDLGRAYATDRPLPPAGSSVAIAAGQHAESTARGKAGAELDWWRDRLAGLPELALPTDRPRPAVASRRAATVRRTLAGEALAGLDALCTETGATRSMAVTVLVSAVLGRRAGQHRFGLGVAVAGRGASGTAEVFGALVNTVVFRADLTGMPSLRAMLTRTRAELFEAIAHDDVPFAEVVQATGAGHPALANPLFQVMLGEQPATAEFWLDGVRAEVTPIPTGVAKFDLSVLIGAAARPGPLEVAFEYDADLFDASTMDRLADQLLRLCAAGVAAPDVPLERLDLMDAADRALLAGWCDGGEVPDLGSPWLHGAILTGASRYPDRIAVAAPEESLSYGALERRVRRLAAGLRSLGVGVEDRVAICHRRTVDLPVAMLGVLAAGAAYLPLRDSDPAERRAEMLADAGARLLLTDADTATWLDAYDVPVVTIDDAVAAAGRTCLALDDPALLSVDQLAYVLYTSGSTGRPKGVGVTHRGALARIAWGRQAFGADEMAGVLGATSLVFDLSLFELFAPLTAGGTVVLAESVLELPTLPDRDRVTLVTTVPSAMAALLDIDGWPGGVRSVALGGEPLSAPLARRVWTRGPGRVINLYGTTEDSFCSTWTELDREVSVVTAGYPLPGSRIVVLARDLVPVPPDVVGEIVSPGVGVSRGYLGRPGLTASVFVPDPAGRPGERQYRTGDRGRWTPYGLDVLGRLDQQVKIRGHRVEPGEIESALLAVPGIAEAVVHLTGHGDAPDRRLVAYLRWRPGEADPDTGALRAALRRRLPEYMVPAAFVTLDAFPRTASGKVDRVGLAAVPVPEVIPDAGEPPHGATETAVAQVWQDLIGVHPIARHDRFFELGGDSLLAARMTRRLSERYGVDLSLRLIFDDDRLLSFAAAVRRATAGSPSA